MKAIRIRGRLFVRVRRNPIEYPEDHDNYLFHYKPYSQTIQLINPEDFLDLCGARASTAKSQPWFSQKSYDSVKAAILAQKPMDPLFLDLDVDKKRVTNHEGRHRSIVCIDLGIKEVPVIFFHKSDDEKHSFDGYWFVRETGPYKDGPYYGEHELPWCCKPSRDGSGVNKHLLYLPQANANPGDAAAKVDAFHRSLKSRYNPSSAATAIFMMGLPAAGKSSYVREHYKSLVGCCIVDPDSIARLHPSYSDADPGPAHYATAHLVEEQFQRAIQKKHTFIIDGTSSKFDKLVRRIEEAKRAGFHTKLVYIAVPLSVSLERNRLRKRHVPESVVVAMAEKVADTFGRAARFLDEVLIVDNSMTSKKYAKHREAVP